MGLYVRVIVEIDNGSRETFHVELERRPPGDNPVFWASNLRGGLDEIRERAVSMVISQYGDRPDGKP